MSQSLPYKNIRLTHAVNWKEMRPNILQKQDTLSTLIWNMQTKLQKENKNFRFCPQNKKYNNDKVSQHMLNLNAKDYKPYAELICDWSDKLEYLAKYMEIGFWWDMKWLLKKLNEILVLGVNLGWKHIFSL